MTISLSLGPYDKLPCRDVPLNLDVATFDLTTSAGNPHICGISFAQYLSGPEFHAGATRTQILEPTTLLLLDFGLVGLAGEQDVEPGKLRAVIRPNGAGKTMFFHLVSGVLRLLS